jgi:hypothetical protein
MSPRRRSRRRILGASALPAAALAAFLAAGGCWDQIADPTQGFIEVATGDVSGAEVFVDGTSMGTSARVGPLDAGTYNVAVARQCYHVAPSSVTVEVRPGRATRADFALELGDAGSVHASAVDEVLGSAVNGAQILLDTGTGLQPTGVVTPGTIDRVPCGEVRVVLRAPGYQDSDPVTLTVVPSETADASVALGPPHAVLAEMFTYVVCPNCPPSAEELKEMQEGDPTHVYVMEWHTTVGLPLYDDRWRARELFYRGPNDRGWPAVVIQGGTDPSHVPEVLVDSQTAELEAYHTRVADYLSACGNDCPLALKVQGSITASGADADVHVLYRGGALPSGLVLTVLLSENHVLAPGNQPGGFWYVARDIDQTPVSFPTAGDVSDFQRSFPVDGSWATSELHLTAWVQSDATHEILAVGGI